MHSKIRAVAFDLDNTLWEVGPVIARAELLLVEWLEEHCPRIPQRVSLADMRAAREQLATEEPHKAHDFTYLRIAALARHARDCGYDEDIAHRAFEVFFAARNAIEPFADVRPALERLRSRYRLASLTNGNADLHRIGIAAWFDLSLSSRDVGVAKPHSRIFQELAARLQLPPQEILYVGDEPDLDVAGPKAVGMKTAWMNRSGGAWPVQLVAADLAVADCAELADALGV